MSNRVQNFKKTLKKYFSTSKLSPLKISPSNAFATSITIILTVINLTILTQQNKLVEQSWKLSQDNLGFEIDTRSQTYAKQAYDDLYLDKDRSSTIEDLKKNITIQDNSKLMQIVDIFEEIGSNFCQGTNKARHIRIYLANTLNKAVCNNSQIYQLYAGNKNGMSILCSEFAPNSLFAKAIKVENLSTCEFIDSHIFQKTNNKERFELK